MARKIVNRHGEYPCRYCNRMLKAPTARGAHEKYRHPAAWRAAKRKAAPPGVQLVFKRKTKHAPVAAAPPAPPIADVRPTPLRFNYCPACGVHLATC